MKLNWNYLGDGVGRGGGGGGQNKKPSVWGVNGYFLEVHIQSSMHIIYKLHKTLKNI